MGSCSFCKDLKDKLKFVDNLTSADFRDIEKLCRRKLVIENYLFCTRASHKFGKFLYLPSSKLIP